MKNLIGGIKENKEIIGLSVIFIGYFVLKYFINK